MPPFREGKIEVDRRLDGETLQELRDIGHGHRITIVDASYDIPRGSRVLKFPGSSADALLSVIKLIPIEDTAFEVMDADSDWEADGEATEVERRAGAAFTRVEDELVEIEGGEIQNGIAYKPRKGENGFYATANNPNEPGLFIRTTDDLPFACVTFLAGHSQITE